MSPLGSRISAGMPASSASSIRHDREPRLAGAGHADDDAVRRQVARADDDPVGARLAGRGVEREPEVEGAAVGHSRRSLESADARRASSSGPALRPRIAERDPATGSGCGSRRARSASASSSSGSTSSSTASSPRIGASVLLVLQGLDASGKDGVIRRVFHGVNPAGCSVTSFRAPVGAELEHDYLWRIHAALPRAAAIGVFNRSHYEDVVAVRMRELAPEAVWRRRYEHLRAFERMLVDEGTTVLKVFLNVSREEQRKRFQERIDDPEKRWKFRREDLEVRRAVRRLGAGRGRRR